jgi:thiol-disulfide isomerase/thioredoxin
MQYLALMRTPLGKLDGGSQIAYLMGLHGHEKEAGPLFEKTITEAAEYRKAHGDDADATDMKVSYDRCCSRYAEILCNQKEYADALRYVQAVYDGTGKPEFEVNQRYAMILMALDRDEEAFDKLDELVKAGITNAWIRNNLEKLYVKVKGAAGYDAYMAKIDGQMNDRMIKSLPTRMIDEPAPSFTLQDMEGRTVSLDDYKGKVVVVDFWATWCGPCKASFPAMQQVVNKYKSDADVQFLFIHTWEKGSNAMEAVREYLEETKYPFHVAMDWKVGSYNPVVKSFNVTGIPTKFIIDKNGHIRFRIMGFVKGTDATAAEELSAMIALAEKS